MSINLFTYLNDGMSYSKRGEKKVKFTLNWYPNLDPLVL